MQWVFYWYQINKLIKHICSCWNRHLRSDPQHPRLKFKYINAKNIYHWHERRGPETVELTKNRKQNKKKPVKLMPDSNIITHESWNNPPTEMFTLLCSHIRAVNATHLETPVTVAHQEQNHSFTAMPRARITNKDVLNILGNKYHSHLTLNCSEHSGKSTGEWMESYRSRQLGQATGLWLVSLIKMFSVTLYFIKIWRKFKRGNLINHQIRG